MILVDSSVWIDHLRGYRLGGDSDVSTIIPKNSIFDALKNSSWDLGNEVLYRLCETHPDHKKEDVIIAKFWLIGRAYAAAIERRKSKDVKLNEDNELDKDNKSNDEFYENIVGPRLRESKIDLWLNDLKSSGIDNQKGAMQVHKNLTDLLHCMTNMDNRSLASRAFAV